MKDFYQSLFVIYLIIACIIFPSQELIAKAKTLTITGDKNYAPYSFLGVKGEPKGLLIDLWNEWAKTTNTEISFELKDWVDSVNAVEKKEIDIHSGVYTSIPNTFNAISLHQTKVSLFANKGYDQVLTSQRVGVIDPFFGEALKKDYPRIEIVLFENYDLLFDAVRKSEIHLFFDSTSPVLSVTTLTAIDSLLEILNLGNKFAHFVQQERGASAGYIGSKGKKFAKKREGIIQQSNQALGRLMQSLKENESLLHSYLTSSQEKELKQFQTMLQRIRDNVEVLNISSASAFSAYTKFISRILLIMRDASDNVKNKTLKSQLYAYSLLGMYKESIGEKRAILNRLFSSDEVDDDLFEIYIATDAQEKIYLKSFLHGLAEKNKKHFSQIFHSSLIAKVRNYEELAYKKMRGETVFVTPEAWSETITDKINLLQEFESVLFTSLMGNEEEIHNERLLTSSQINTYQIVPLKNDYFFALHPMLHDESLVAKVNNGFEKIPVERLREIEAKWIDDSNRFLYKKTPSSSLSFPVTEEEQAWLDKKIPIRYVYDPDWAPFEWKSDIGKHVGIISDLLELVKEKTGINLIPLHVETWAEAIKLAKNRSGDMYSGLGLTEERKTYMNFTEENIFSTPYVFVSKEGGKPFSNFADLKEKKVAVVDGYTIHGILKEHEPQLPLLLLKGTQEGFEKLLTNEIDVFVINMVTAKYFLKRKEYHLLKVEGKTGYKLGLKIAVRNDWPLEVLSLLNKGLVAITDKELSLIYEKWVSKREALEFNKKERLWLKNNKPIRFVTNPDWAPFEWTNDVGHHSGFISDIIQFLKVKSGLNLFHIKTKTWAESTKLVKDRDADMYSAVGANNERKTYMNFSKKALFSTPYVFVGRKGENFSEGFKPFKNAGTHDKLALVENYTIHGIMKKNLPDIPLTLLSGTEEGFKKLLSNEIDAFLVNTVTAKFFISKYAYKDLEITYLTDYTLNLHLAVRNDWPDEVLSILDKTIASLDANELNSIYEKWTKVEETEVIDYKSLDEEIRNLSLIETLQLEEILFALFIVLLVAYFIYQNYSESKFLNIRFSRFILLIICLELIMISFIIFEVVVLDRFENSLATVHRDKFEMVKVADQLRQSSDDLSHYARTYSVTNKPEYKQTYYDILDIRNGLKARPKNYETIYWDLNKKLRERHHPDGEKNSLKDLMVGLPYSKEELHLLKLSEDNSNDLVELEARAFQAMKENNQTLAMQLLHSKAYYQAKVKIMEPIDNMLNSINDRSNLQLNLLEQKISTVYKTILLATVFFLLGNFLIYLMLVKKIREPLSYLIDSINQFKSGSKILEEKTFYHDEIGEVNKEFFSMKMVIEERSKEIEAIHKLTRDSIEYAALIQGALIPDNTIFIKYFQQYFTIWHPKDVVGGDIYLMEEINDHEVLLMVIDCTGHGVPGAFVTMLVKAVERQLIANIHKDPIISPAKLLGVFNRSIRTLLKQESIDSISNAGFDGGILYYNKKTNIIKYSGANTALFYVENGGIEVIKGSRHSIGYKKSDPNYEFKEHTIEATKGMQIYLTTDGYLDQNGGEKGFPFGRKRFVKLLEEYKDETMADQQEVLLYELQAYEEGFERNDDVTVIGIKL